MNRKSCVVPVFALIGTLFAGGIADSAPAVKKAAAVKSIPLKIKHLGQGATVTVSSTHQGNPDEQESSVLVDGDLSSRWSSEYSEPQQITLDLGAVKKMEGLRLHWEMASAARYRVSVSADGKTWTDVHLYMNMSPRIEDRKDDVEMKRLPARFIKIDLLARVREDWGFSLYEIEVLGEP